MHVNRWSRWLPISPATALQDATARRDAVAPSRRDARGGGGALANTAAQAVPRLFQERDPGERPNSALRPAQGPVQRHGPSGLPTPGVALPTLAPIGWRATPPARSDTDSRSSGRSPPAPARPSRQNP